MIFQGRTKLWLTGGSLMIFAFLFSLFFWPATLIAQSDITNTAFFFGKFGQSSKKSDNLEKIAKENVQKLKKTYGPVVTDEMLWDIADNLRIERKTSSAQMAVALFKRNPKAFQNKNINGLLIGAVLEIPDNAEITRYSKEAALNMIEQHWQSWQSFKKNIALEQKLKEQNFSNNTLPSEEQTTASQIEHQEEVQNIQEQQQTFNINQANDEITPANIIPVEMGLSTISDNLISDENELSFISVSNDKEPGVTSATSVPVETGDNIISTKPVAVAKVVAPVEPELSKKGHSVVVLNTLKTLPENKTIDTEPSLSFFEKTKLELFGFINYLSHIEFDSIQKQLRKNYDELVLWSKNDFDSSVLTSDFKERWIQSPLFILSIVFTLFILLVFVFRKQEKKLNQISTPVQDSPHIVFDETVNEQKHYAINYKISDVIYDNELDSKIEQITANIVSGEHNDQEEQQLITDDFVKEDLTDPIMNQVNIHNFLNPPETKQNNRNTKVQSTSKRENLLESAFGQDMFSTGVGFIQNEIADETKHKSEPKNTESGEFDLLDSVDELRYVNEKTSDSKINAFWQITRQDKLSNDSLQKELTDIKTDDNLEIFIEEFEQIIKSLSQQTPAIEQEPGELEHIVQFKLSVHFIKVLSEMMQATYLKQFTTIVIEFLEEILDGKARMTDEVASRLALVVNFYDQYIHSAKEIQNYKIKL